MTSARISILIFLIMLFLTNCEDKPLWMDEDFDINSINIESLNIDKMAINDMSLIKSKNDLIQKVGKPKYILRNCFSYKNIKYDCWVYENDLSSVYYVFDTITYLHFVNFNYCNCSITDSIISLSKTMTINEIKQLFPNSYSIRNIGVDIQYSKYDRIYLADGLSNDFNERNGTIILRFKNNKLANFEYSPPIKKSYDSILINKSNFDNLFDSSEKIIIDTIY